MSATPARTKAERCFALARSTTFDGERDNAVARGIAIAEAAGLDLDTFDIPGRVKASKPRPVEQPSFRFTARSGRAPEQYTSADIEELMRQYRAHMGERYSATGRDPGWTGVFYGAWPGSEADDIRAAEERRRTAWAAQQAEAEEARKAQAAQSSALADKVANALWGLGWRVYRDGDGEDGRRRWHVTSATGATWENVDDWRLILIGSEHGGAGAIPETHRDHVASIQEAFRRKAERESKGTASDCPSCGRPRVRRGFFRVCESCEL